MAELSLFYLWRLEEGAQALLAMCREAGIPCEGLEALPEKRQRERAAELLLLCRAFGRPVELSHTAQGAPHVDGSDVNISISHTPRLVVLACNAHHVIGVDAEEADRHQVLRVRDKFLNAAEQQFIAPDDLAAHVIAWTAKEAIIKAERNSALDWTDGIELEPFESHDGVVLMRAQCGSNHYRLESRQLEGHRITVALPDEGES